MADASTTQPVLPAPQPSPLSTIPTSIPPVSTEQEANPAPTPPELPQVLYNTDTRRFEMHHDIAAAKASGKFGIPVKPVGGEFTKNFLLPGQDKTDWEPAEDSEVLAAQQAHDIQEHPVLGRVAAAAKGYLASMEGEAAGVIPGVRSALDMIDPLGLAVSLDRQREDTLLNPGLTTASTIAGSLAQGNEISKLAGGLPSLITAAGAGGFTGYLNESDLGNIPYNAESALVHTGIGAAMGLATAGVFGSLGLVAKGVAKLAGGTEKAIVDTAAELLANKGIESADKLSAEAQKVDFANLPPDNLYVNPEANESFRQMIRSSMPKALEHLSENPGLAENQEQYTDALEDINATGQLNAEFNATHAGGLQKAASKIGRALGRSKEFAAFALGNSPAGMGEIYTGLTVASKALKVASQYPRVLYDTPVQFLSTLAAVHNASATVAGMVTKAAGGVLNIAPAALDAAANRAKKLDLQDLFETEEPKIQALPADPSSMLNVIQQNLDPVLKYAPQHGGFMAATALRGAMALQQALPQNPHPDPMNPTTDVNWKPSDTQLSNYYDVRQAVLEPRTVFDDARDGTLSPLKWNTFKSVYPTLADDFNTELKKQLFKKSDQPLTLSQKRIVKMVTGIQTPDITPAQVAFQQNIFANRPQYGAPEPNKKNPTQSGLNKLSFDETAATPMQGVNIRKNS
jgi:hypothetical protein